MLINIIMIMCFAVTCPKDGAGMTDICDSTDYVVYSNSYRLYYNVFKGV